MSAKKDWRGRAIQLAGAVKYSRNSIVSKTLLDKKAGTLTLFAFDAGQGLSEHTAPYDATVQILEGDAELTIGGKVVKAIVEETGAEINIEDDGTVTVAAVDKDSIDKALAKISAITEDVEIGRIYNGRVKKVMEYGAFVEIFPVRPYRSTISRASAKVLTSGAVGPEAITSGRSPITSESRRETTVAG